MFDYPPAIARFIGEANPMSLNGGTADEDFRTDFGAVSLEGLFLPHAISDRAAAELCIAALWLHNDCLAESHLVAQRHEIPDGNYWHAILHRREGDFWNSKYWLRRVGKHPVFGMLVTDIHQWYGQGDELQIEGLRTLVSGATWDPFLFVDLCELAVGSEGLLRDICLQIQQREWELLLRHCFLKAIGEG